MKTFSTIFQASDLNQRGRAILDAAREGWARLRDKDGFSLVMLPEERVEALRGVANAVANLFAVEHALAAAEEAPPSIYEFGQWTWLRVFDEEDLREFVREMHEGLMVAAREESLVIVEETLHRWRTTAQALDDPLRRSILLGGPGEEDFVEVERPE